MAKIIVASRYMRNAPNRSAANLLRYMATREGVEKVPAGTDRRPTTVRQERMIRSILSAEPEKEI